MLWCHATWYVIIKNSFNIVILRNIDVKLTVFCFILSSCVLPATWSFRNQYDMPVIGGQETFLIIAVVILVERDTFSLKNPLITMFKRTVVFFVTL